MRLAVTILLTTLVLAAPAAAQQRPLVTEDPETIGSGLILLETGFDVQHDLLFPASGLEGNLLRLATTGLSIGVSSIAEIQVDAGPYNHLSITDRHPAPLRYLLDFTGEGTHDIEDFTVGAKIRLVAETPGGPAIAVRFATRLPNASNESGLGLDTFDFHAGFLVGKTVQSVRVVGNAGLGILGDPVVGHSQNDVFTYGFSLARAVAEGFEVVGEINGRVNVREREAPAGTETRGVFRVGGRYTRNAVRIDGGLLIGTTANDPSFGFTGGVTWVFRGFTVP